MSESTKDTRISIGEFLSQREHIPVIDVRTPAEFKKAHIPGAVNVPLFSNEQRVVIGTLYKQKSKDAAIMQGLDFVGPEMSRIVKDAKRLTRDKQIIVHCWRGGMRSESVGWLLQFSGLKPQVLEGGYKTYRREMLKLHVRPMQYQVLGGMTGSGKTDILKALEANGAQIIDLEGLANHKGSVFGGIGQPEQPSTEMFENLLAEEILKLDSNRCCWIEDESANIGQARMPKSFWDIKRTSPIYELKLSRKTRIERLVNEYGNQDKEELIAAIHRITKRLGNERAQKSIGAINEGNMALVADVVLDYYDKGYQNAMSREEKNRQHLICKVDEEFNADKIALDLIKLSNQTI